MNAPHDKFLQGKELILDSLRETCASIHAVRPPKEALQASYESWMEKAREVRGNPLFYPYLGSGRGNGLFVELEDGSVKYDLICGIGVHFFGHCHLGLASQLIDAACQDTVMQGNLQQNVDSIQLCKELTALAGMDHVFLTTSGAMACENALKIIFQKKQPASRLIAFEGCFMGRTTTLAQVTDKPQFREGLPETIHVDYIPFFDPNDEEGSIERAKAALLGHISRYPKQHAALLMELVQGERGFFVGSQRFFHTLIQVAKEAGLAIFVDEVQTFARTEKLFAFQHFGLNSIDVLTIGKVAQLGATFWNEEFNPKPNLLSQTFTASTSSIRACSYILKELQVGGYFGKEGKNARLHKAFEERLSKLFPYAQGPFGIGSMVAFTPFHGDKAAVDKLAKKLFERGIIAFIAGSNPTRLRFLLPAGCMEEKDVDSVMTIIEKVLKEASAS